MIKWLQSKVEGRIGVVTPFNGQFVEELKALSSSAKFDRAAGAWFFDEEVKPEVLALVEKFFTSPRPWVRIEWGLRSEAAVTIDGIDLFWISRDRWNWRRDGGLEYRIIEQDLRSGGSMRYPNISGRAVIEIALRAGAVIRPEPDSIQPLEKEPKRPVNPLEHFDTADLLAELERRGVTA